MIRKHCFVLQIDADEDNQNTKDDEDIEEVSQPILKALNDNWLSNTEVRFESVLYVGAGYDDVGRIYMRFYVLYFRCVHKMTIRLKFFTRKCRTIWTVTETKIL